VDKTHPQLDRSFTRAGLKQLPGRFHHPETPPRQGGMLGETSRGKRAGSWRMDKWVKPFHDRGSRTRGI
jgi:hypothetical protein